LPALLLGLCAGYFYQLGPPAGIMANEIVECRHRQWLWLNANLPQTLHEGRILECHIYFTIQPSGWLGQRS
jgi:hypothetical protein